MINYKSIQTMKLIQTLSVGGYADIELKLLVARNANKLLIVITSPGQRPFLSISASLQLALRAFMRADLKAGANPW